MTARRLVIDSDLCTAHGRCAQIAPSAFELDADGYGVVRGDWAGVADEAVERAIALCPEGAIHWDDLLKISGGDN